jgi:hypothetical protein
LESGGETACSSSVSEGTSSTKIHSVLTFEDTFSAKTKCLKQNRSQQGDQ